TRGGLLSIRRSRETLGILTGGIAHDFNNLLVTIIGNVDLALRKLPPDTPVYRQLNLIRTASVRASGLAAQLLAYSGDGVITCEPVNMNAVVDETAALFSVSIPKRITLRLCLAEAPPVVLANEIQVRQILMNLITNAIDAIGNREGEITIRTGITGAPPNHPGDGEAGDYAFFEVTDAGHGIAEEHAPRIFEPFFTTKPSGRGLGLAVVKEHVENCRGYITHSSEPGKGTIFTVYLPSTDLPVKVPLKADESPSGEESLSGTVLVIDDEADVLETTGAMIREAGMEFFAAQSGKEGIRLFRDNSGNIDVVLLDMAMPSLDGGVVMNELRTIRKNLPIIVTSGYGIDDIANTFSCNEIGTYLKKPYQMDELMGAIRGLLRGKISE
ncbi:ATP-binding protein, partial [Candidatus Latescibacterota bacterium]